MSYMQHMDLLLRQRVLLEVPVVQIDLGVVNRIVVSKSDRHNHYDFHLHLHDQSLQPV